MRELIIKFGMILLVSIAWSCVDPSPTELIYNNSNDYGVELLQEPEVYVNSSTYDSTGITDEIPKYTTVISVNGIKTTLNRITIHQYYAMALFSDKTQPVKTPEGKLLGYRLNTPGKVFFDDTEARLANRKISFLGGTQIRDTLLGKYYEIRERMGHGHQHQKEFAYNSSVEFRLVPADTQPILFNIPTPAEITGNVKVTGSQKGKNISIAVDWNSANEDSITLILGAEEKSDIITPLIRVKIKDNGQFVLPKEFLKNIPFDRFKSFVIILERQKTLHTDIPELSDNRIQSKSIHNIRFNVP